MTHLSKLASLAASATPPAETRAKTALILADSLGAIVGGAAEAEVGALTARLAADAPGTATVIGPGRTAAPGTAALLNGAAGTTLEMDEGNQFCKGHPGIHVIPAVLAAATGRAVSGADLLTAIAVGYEAAARVGIATALRASMHPHGTWGAIGAAAGVGRLRGRSAEEIREAMNVAANLGLTTSRRTMLEGGTVRNVFAGVSNRMGLLADDLVASGYTADAEAVAHVFGRVASDSFDPDALTEDLGTRWEVDRNYFKMHSCCRYNHATLDVLDRLLAETPDLAADAIERVEVETYSLAVELDDPAPKNVLGAKFSVPFAVATRLVTGASGVGSFTAERVADPGILALAARVSVAEDPEMTARLPDERPSRVTIHLKDGGTLDGETRTNRGDWRDPYPADELREKFLSLATRLWPEDHAAAVWDMALGLDGADDAAPLLDAAAYSTA